MQALYFGLLSGATPGGNCTPISTSANTTGIGILRKEGYSVKNADIFKTGMPFTMAAIALHTFIYGSYLVHKARKEHNLC